MTQAPLYNSDTVDESQSGFVLLPEGYYQLMVEDLIFGQTKKKLAGNATKGMLIEMRLNVLDDAYRTEQVKHFFNIQNDNEKAELIGRADFKTFHKALGIQSLALAVETDLLPLRHKVVVAYIGHESREYEGKTYKSGKIVAKSWLTKAEHQAKKAKEAIEKTAQKQEPAPVVGNPAMDDVPF